MDDIIRREDLPKMDFSRDATGEKLPPVTPGEVLREDFLLPLGLSGRALAADLGIPANRVTESIAGRRAISAETALMLGERFGTPLNSGWACRWHMIWSGRGPRS